MATSGVRVSAFQVPTETPESDGTLAWKSTTLVTVEIGDGETGGFGYTYADQATAHFVREHLCALIQAADPLAVSSTFEAMQRVVRNVGRDGVGAMAIAAADMALWDRKAKLAHLPLAALLGACREEVPAYRSGGFTSYSIDELRRWIEATAGGGFRHTKMKIGRGADTIARVAAVRSALPADQALFVDANGAYGPREALGLAGALADRGVTWFEEPVTSDDLAGLRFVREHVPAAVAVAAGEYGYRASYFDRMLAAGAVDVLQADATRCGVSGFVAAAALCEERHVRLSAHCAPSVHAQLGCAFAGVLNVEYFFDHVRIERMLFDGAQPAARGALRPDPSRPGLGVALKRSDARRYCVYDERAESGGS